MKFDYNGTTTIDVSMSVTSVHHRDGFLQTNRQLSQVRRAVSVDAHRGLTPKTDAIVDRRIELVLPIVAQMRSVLDQLSVCEAWTVYEVLCAFSS